MPRSRSVTLKGDAAKAFILSQAGVKPKTDVEALQLIATRIHMEIRTENMKGAVQILEHLVKYGAASTAEAVSKA